MGPEGPEGPAGPEGPEGPAGTPTRQLLATWTGELPDAPAVSSIWRVPFVDGAPMTFDLERAFARVETPGAGDTEFTLEEAPGGEVAFVGSTIVVLTVPDTEREVEDAAVPGQVSSGDLLRLSVTAVGTTGTYIVELQGTEAP